MANRSWRLFVVALCVGAVVPAAWAQEDDDLAPLAPLKSKPKPKAKPKPKPKPEVKPAPLSRPVDARPVDDDLAPIAPIVTKGELNVRVASSVSGAVLSIDGHEVGVLPLAAQSVSSGEHTVNVKRPGFAAFVKKVVVVASRRLDVDVKLAPVAAVLSVTSDVPGAQVLINGKSIGTVPLTNVEVPPGPAELAVVKEGYQEDTQRLVLVAGRDYPVSVKFNPAASTTLVATDRPVATTLVPDDGPQDLGLSTSAAADREPITSKWYFWVGIIAGVAAVAVGTTVAVQASQPGAPTATEICGGVPCDGCIGVACFQPTR